jgi:deoxyribodipyrimidine photolyase
LTIRSWSNNYSSISSSEEFRLDFAACRDLLGQRLAEPPTRIQFITGPRQVGKTAMRRRKMTREHLKALEQELTAAGIKETYRGQAWSDNCREFVYFDCVLDRESIRRRLKHADCIRDSDYLGTHMGSEYGFYCEQCQDGIMGAHPARSGNHRLFT